MRRATATTLPAAVELTVHLPAAAIDDDDKRKISYGHRRGRIIGLGVVGLFIGWWEIVRFCTSRCYLIDWSAGTQLTEVPIVHTQSQLNQHIAAHEPALLQDALHSWPAVGKWSPSFFGAQSWSCRRVEIFFWGRSGADWMKTRVYALKLSEYARLLQNYEERVRTLGRESAGPAPYLQEDETLFATHEERLLPDVRHFPFRPFLASGGSSRPLSSHGRHSAHLIDHAGGGSDRSGGAAAGGAASDAVGGGPLPIGMQTETAFWMGPTNARTGIHWDSINAILHQIHGTKTITLWPPNARSQLYVSSKYNHGAELSEVDAAKPNHTKYPLFASAKSLTATLKAGSALFLPAGWWHAVTSLDATISIALRSQGSCERKAALADDLLLWLHQMGLYKRGNSVYAAAAAAGSDEDGLGSAVEELLRASGVDVEKAMRAASEESGEEEEEGCADG